MLVVIFACLVSFLSGNVNATERPIIGVLTQVIAIIINPHIYDKHWCDCSLESINHLGSCVIEKLGSKCTEWYS